VRTISEYLRQRSALRKPQAYDINDGEQDPRIRQIAIIQDMLNGYEAIHAKNRWKTECSQLDDDDWYKQFITFNYMEKVINELKTLAPYMENFNTDDERKIKILKKTLEEEHLNFKQLLYEIYETLETKGDFFAYWSTNEESKVGGIPVLKVLESENMYDIQKDPLTNEVIAYIYKEYIVEEELDEDTGTLNEVNAREVTWIFKKGYIRVNDSVKYADSDGYMIFENKPEYSDIIRLIHVPSFKNQKDKFSDIPASEYIDPCLLLDKTDTNRNIINDHLAFPIPIITGGLIDEDNSALIAGGAMYIEPEEWVQNMDKMPTVNFMEISNDIKSLVDEKYDAVTDLYKKACLIREQLEEKLSTSDSSRNISQLRLGIEQKNKKYYKNIAEAFAKYFRVVLKEHKAIKAKEFKIKEKFTFEIPDVLVNNSIFDDLLIKLQKRNLGYSTLEEELKTEGMTKQQIENRKRIINEEMYTNTNDMSVDKQPKEVVDRVSNGANNDDVKGSGLDNRFKK